MLRKLILCVIINFLFISLNNASTIYFTYPTNNSIVHNTYDTDKVAVNILFYYEANSGNYMYIKLFTHNETYNSRDNLPQWLYLVPGIYNWRIELWEGNVLGQEFKTAEQSISFQVMFTLTVKNNFDSGNVSIDNTTLPSNSKVYKYIGDNISLVAIDQNDSQGYNRIWNSNGTYNSIWYRNGSPISGATSREFVYKIKNDDNGVILTANLRRVCNLTFNSPGGVYINGITYPSPKVVEVVEQNTVTVSGQWYYSNGIEYSFSHWTSGGQTYLSTITANEHKSFNAVYIGKPSNSIEYVHFGTIVNEPIEIYWNDNPNPNVTQYQIWRKVKHNGVMGNPVLIATVNRGVGTYTDYDYILTSTYSHDLLLYDVRAYYSVDNTYSEEDWYSVYGQMSPEIKEVEQKEASEEELPTRYSISNYPNPFNPETVIKYQLPESGYVTIKVYDILGKEIATLVNEYKEAGYYNYTFSIINYTLPSGIYIYTLNVNGITQTKKMILAK